MARQKEWGFGQHFSEKNRIAKIDESDWTTKGYFLEQNLCSEYGVRRPPHMKKHKIA
jgi:hypothetical protein